MRNQSSSYGSSVFAHSQEDEEEEKDDILFSYDFHPVPPIDSSPSRTSTVRNCNSMDHVGSAKVTLEKVGTSSETAFISVIERNMKELSDNLLHAVKGLSARLSQLESRTRHFENSLDELKESVDHNQGKTDGKLRQLENILREVHGGIHDLRDKQEISEAQLQLAMLRVSKRDTLAENQKSSGQTDVVQNMSSSAAQEFHKSLPNPDTSSQTIPGLPFNSPPDHSHQNPTLVPPAPPQQPLPPAPPQQPLPPAPARAAAAAIQPPTQFPLNPIPPQPEFYYAPPAPTQETTFQQYNITPTHQSQAPLPATHQPYHLASQPQQIPPSTHQPGLYSPLSNVSSQVHPSLNYHAEGTSYIPSQSYHQTTHQPSQPPGGTLSTQQFYPGSSQKMHEENWNRPSSGFTTQYSPAGGYSNFSDYDPHTGSPSYYVSSTVKPSQFVPPHSVPSIGSGNPNLPTAKLLPLTLPTTSSVSGGSGSSDTGNRVPADDIVDKVSAMGFRRDQVRAMVKKLTDDGQSVDLNVVLDKLMKNG